MNEESKRTKALRDFLVASPHDYHRKWAEYVALAPDVAGFLDPKRGQAMESSSSASPAAHSTASLRVLRSAAPTSESSLKRNSTRDSFQSMTPSTCSTVFLKDDTTMSPTSAAAVSASTSACIPPSATTPAASTSCGVDFVLAPSTACSTDLAPESEAIYQLLMADQSVYEVRFAEYAEKYGPSSCRRSGNLPPRATAAVAAHAGLAVHSTSATSSKGVRSARPPTTVPTAPATALNGAPVAVDIDAADLGTTVPTSCSSECPSHEAAVPLSVIISSATPNSPTTTWGVLPELATPAVSDKALDMDVVGNTSGADTICLPADLDGSTGEEEVLVDVSLTTESALASFVLPQVFESMAPHWCLIICSVEDTCVLMPRFNRALLPWPSFKCSQVWTQSWPVHIHEKNSGLMCKPRGITSGYDTKSGDVTGCSDVYAIDGYYRVKPTVHCMIIATSIEQDLQSDCKTLLSCCSNIPGDALRNRVSVTLLESVVQLVLSGINFGGTVHLQFNGPLHDEHVYWSFSYLHVYWNPELIQWTIIWFHQLLETGFQFGIAGKTSLYGYGFALFQWVIAWLPTTRSCSITWRLRSTDWLFISFLCYTCTGTLVALADFILVCFRLVTSVPRD